MSAAEQSRHGRPSTDVESPPDAAIRIGVSTCLLGEHVRFDGGHKRDPFLVETFGRYVEWVSVLVERVFAYPCRHRRISNRTPKN